MSGRRMRRTTAVIAIVASLVTAMSCGGPSAPTVAGSPAASAVDRATDINGLVDVGDGRKMHVECSGTGSPTVFLIAGRGNGADDWTQILDPADPVHDAPGDDLGFGMGTLIHSDQAVFPSVARFTRVCTYDRPDIRVDGEVTTSRPQPHTVDLDVSDLHALAAAIGESGPKVLVAHSYGGLIATLYARTYPDEVSGLVMVDTVSQLMAQVVAPTALRNWDSDNATTSPQVREGVQLLDAFRQIDAAPPVPKVPAVVLAADKPWRTDLLPAELRDRESVTFANWLAQLDRLATALDAEKVTDTHSGHDIYLYNPSIVVDAIQLVANEVRTAAEGDAGR